MLTFKDKHTAVANVSEQLASWPDSFSFSSSPLKKKIGERRGERLGEWETRKERELGRERERQGEILASDMIHGFSSRNTLSGFNLSSRRCKHRPVCLSDQACVFMCLCV